MTLARETELGTISISNLLFAQVIADCFRTETCKGKIWPATKKGRQIGTDKKFNLSEFANAIEVDESLEEGRIDIEFNVIVKFGVSISGICETVSDLIAARMEEKQGNKPYQIKIRVTGVKSKQIAKRNLEVMKQYGIEG